MNGHKVINVTDLYYAAKKLYETYVVGSDDSSADTILLNLQHGIESLKNSWKGVDAGIQINSVIKVYNAMVIVRNSLAQLASDSSKVAVSYREIQIANAAVLDELIVLSFDPKTVMSEYTDTADTIDITLEANTGKSKIDLANTSLDSFVVAVRVVYEEIMNNWLSGTGRDDAISAFESFCTCVNEYKQVLAEVSVNVTTALRNYGLL